MSESSVFPRSTGRRAFLRRCVLASVVVVVLGAPPATGQVVHHGFVGGFGDGAAPMSQTLHWDGTFLVGTTSGGGANGLGTVYRIRPDGSGYQVLLDFDGTPGSPATPSGGLVGDGDRLYGLSASGGMDGVGTVYSILPDGTGLAVVHSFASSGVHSPRSELVLVGSTFTGIANAGNGFGCGGIFQVETSGGFSVPVSLSGGADGCNPTGELVSDGVRLYGMLSNAGAGGFGTIFSLEFDGSGYTTIHTFTGGSQGQAPLGGLFSDGVHLFGMTSAGGDGGTGTVFRILPNGTGFTKLHDFDATGDFGAAPVGSLTGLGGKLYGLTSAGGASSLGTAFRIGIDGSGFTLLSEFAGGADPASPVGGSPTAIGDRLYATTPSGGGSGLGTVFELPGALPVAGRSCLDVLQQGFSVGDGDYVIDLDGPGGADPIQASCDMTTDDGGWTLVLNYVHQGGTVPDATVRTSDLPLRGSGVLGDDESGTQYWGHTSSALFAQFQAAEVRFYGKTSAHGRAIHFKTDLRSCLDYFSTGTGDCHGIENASSLLPLGGGEVQANLPWAAEGGQANQLDLALTENPFSVDSTHHWTIDGEFTTERWEVDDASAGPAHHTIHRAWVREEETDLVAEGYSCYDILSGGGSVGDGVYVIDPDGPGYGLGPMPAYCDMTTDGGGWTLVANYLHAGGTTPNVRVRSTDLPQLGSSTLGTDESGTEFWGHASNELLGWMYSLEIWFEGRTSGVSEIVDFKTDLYSCISYFESGSGSCAGVESQYVPFGPHTAHLPGSADLFQASNGDLALTDLPFAEDGVHHWAIGADPAPPTDVDRWEVDDVAPNGVNDTQHRVWVRDGIPNPPPPPNPVCSEILSLAPGVWDGISFPCDVTRHRAENPFPADLNFISSSPIDTTGMPADPSEPGAVLTWAIDSLLGDSSSYDVSLYGPEKSGLTLHISGTPDPGVYSGPMLDAFLLAEGEGIYVLEAVVASRGKSGVQVLEVALEIPKGHTVEDVLGDDLPIGTYGTDWGVWEWQPTPLPGSYAQLASTDPVFPRSGYWIKSLSGGTISADGAFNGWETGGSRDWVDSPLVGDSTPHPNFLGNPFEASFVGERIVIPGPLYWDQIHVDGETLANAETNGWVERFGYVWNGSAYSTLDPDLGQIPSNEVLPFTGFWIKGTDDSVTRYLEVPPPDAGGQLLTGSGHAQHYLDDEWLLYLSVASGDLEDRYNLVGQLRDAADGPDGHDLPELAPFGAPWLTIVFPRPGWPGDLDRLTGDIQEAGACRTGSWPVEVRSDDPSRIVSLSWEDVVGTAEILPRLTLVDDHTGDRIPLTPGGRHEVVMERTHRSFTLELGPCGPTASIFGDGFESGDSTRWSGAR